MILENKTDLLTLPLKNKPGVCEVWVMDWADVIDMPTKKSILKSLAENASYISLNQISVKPGAKWLKVSNDNEANTSLREKETKNVQGKSFTYELPFLQPNDSELKGRIIRAYDDREWIVAVKEATGAWRLLGSKEQGAEFTDELSTGEQVNGFNVFNGGFIWECSERALYIKANGISPSITIGSVTENPAGGLDVTVTDISNVVTPVDSTLQGYDEDDEDWTDLDNTPIAETGITTFGNANPGPNITFTRVRMTGGFMSNVIAAGPFTQILANSQTGGKLTNRDNGFELTDG